MEQRTESRSYSVKSAERVLEVLEFFAESRRGATVKEISTGLNYPQSSTSILMRSLHNSGYLNHDARTGMYSPNVRLALATAWITEDLYSEHSLLGLMERIHSACGHSVMIGKLDGVFIRYLHVLHSTRSNPVKAKIGSLRPVFRTASGKMMLTTKTEREMGLMLRRANALETDPKRRVDEASARFERSEAIRLGYATSFGGNTAGAAALAIMLPVPRHSDPMTLCIGGAVAEIESEVERLLALLREEVAQLRSFVTG